MQTNNQKRFGCIGHALVDDLATTLEPRSISSGAQKRSKQICNQLGWLLLGKNQWAFFWRTSQVLRV